MTNTNEELQDILKHINGLRIVCETIGSPALLSELMKVEGKVKNIICPDKTTYTHKGIDSKSTTEENKELQERCVNKVLHEVNTSCIDSVVEVVIQATKDSMGSVETYGFNDFFEEVKNLKITPLELAALLESQPPKSEHVYVDVEKLIEETYNFVTNILIGIGAKLPNQQCKIGSVGSADFHIKSTSKHIVQNILSQSPPKAEPVDLEDIVTHFSSILARVKRPEKSIHGGTMDKGYDEALLWFKELQSPHQTKE